jgi:DNA phosphorothioation-dependent restriction protein DptG
MSELESRVKFLEQHIEKMYDHIEEWKRLALKKDEIIDTYKELLDHYKGKLEQQRDEI